MSFWGLIIAYPNGGQLVPSAKSAPLAQTSSYATGCSTARDTRTKDKKHRTIVLH